MSDFSSVGEVREEEEMTPVDRLDMEQGRMEVRQVIADHAQDRRAIERIIENARMDARLLYGSLATLIGSVTGRVRFRIDGREDMRSRVEVAFIVHLLRAYVALMWT